MDYDSAGSRIKSKMRHAIWERDRRQCYLCSTRLELNQMTLDHIVPRCEQGSSRPANLAACCERCNGLKGEADPREYGWPEDHAALPRMMWDRACSLGKPAKQRTYGLTDKAASALAMLRAGASMGLHRAKEAVVVASRRGHCINLNATDVQTLREAGYLDVPIKWAAAKAAIRRGDYALKIT